jgi:hypothetical protein
LWCGGGGGGAAPSVDTGVQHTIPCVERGDGAMVHQWKLEV